jgi:hypothetical protein
MPFRFRAFFFHILASACVLSLVLGLLYMGWYRWPGWYLTNVLHIAATVVIVDVGLGPLLTLVIANPRKPRRELTRDVAVIVLFQLAGLIYGVSVLWHGRPVFYTFSVASLDVVQASAIREDEIARARRENPAFAPHWYSLPRWVWAPFPSDPDEAAKILRGAISGEGQDVISMPRYFRPWSAGLPSLGERLTPVAQNTKLSKAQKAVVAARMVRLGLPVDQANAMILWATDGVHRLVVIFDRPSLRISAMINPDRP